MSEPINNSDQEILMDPAVQNVLIETNGSDWSHPVIKAAIVKVLLNHVEYNGSCRAGWAAEFITKNKQQNHVHDKIAGLATRTGMYLKERNEQFPKDWTIYRNPNYEFVQISKKTSVIQRRALYITVGVSVLTLILLIMNYTLSRKNQTNQKNLQQQIDDIKTRINRTDSVGLQ